MFTSRVWRCTAFVICLAACLVPSAALAQATGAIAGLVTDPSGGVLPGVTIEVVSRDTGQGRNAVTGPDGFLNVPLVNPGLYRVTATLSGFRTTARDTVRVVVNETVRADLSRRVGGLSETVVIVAESPLVETTKPTLGVVIDGEKVVDLPLNGRNFTQLGTLIPGVVAPPTGLGGADGNATPGGFGNVTGGFLIIGMRYQKHNFFLKCSANKTTLKTSFT